MPDLLSVMMCERRAQSPCVSGDSHKSSLACQKHIDIRRPRWTTPLSDSLALAAAPPRDQRARARPRAPGSLAGDVPSVLPCARAVLNNTANACTLYSFAPVRTHAHTLGEERCAYAGRREMRVRISQMGHDAISALRSCAAVRLATSPFRSSAPAAPAAPPSTARQSAVRRGPSA